MTILQQTITIILCALGTMLTRFLPFLVFNPKKPTPKYIQYLGSALPGAIFGMLVVYCLRNVDVLHFAYGCRSWNFCIFTSDCITSAKV